MIMKMHGLGDCPYWMINYAYFLSISSAYMLILVLLGSLIGKIFKDLNNDITLHNLLSPHLRCVLTGLRLFKVPDYSVQFVFYFGYINLQIAFAILASTLFSAVKTASGSYIINPILFFQINLIYRQLNSP